MAIIGDKGQLVRFSFVNVWEPKAMDQNAEPKYSVQILIPKSYVSILDYVRKCMDHAIQQQVGKGVLTAAAVKSPGFKWCLRDGDIEADASTDKGKEYLRGHMFLNASNKEQPSVVDKYAKPIMRKEDVYSGMYGIADVNFWAYKNKAIGVTAYLNSIMKRDDGERLDGRVSAETAFADYKDEIGSEDSLT